MPWYRLAFTPDVLADLAPLEKEFAQRLFDKTKWLASNIANLRHDPIAQDLPGVAKYAVGDWRIFYAVDREDHLLIIYGIIHKKDIA
ncbi:MAG: type II toxin-antitoxin system RelE/ParE family toxin [Nitrospirales bacterium]|nr:type II toxin-antitoxin system RelE/ParE family toxin [Nitrospirales bacterium]